MEVLGYGFVGALIAGGVAFASVYIAALFAIFDWGDRLDRRHTEEREAWWRELYARPRPVMRIGKRIEFSPLEVMPTAFDDRGGEPHEPIPPGVYELVGNRE